LIVSVPLFFALSPAPQTLSAPPPPYAIMPAVFRTGGTKRPTLSTWRIGNGLETVRENFASGMPRRPHTAAPPTGHPGVHRHPALSHPFGATACGAQKPWARWKAGETRGGTGLMVAGPVDDDRNRDVTRPRHPAHGDPWIACRPAGRIRVFRSRAAQPPLRGFTLDLKTRIRRPLGKRFRVGFAPEARGWRPGIYCVCRAILRSATINGSQIWKSNPNAASAPACRAGRVVRHK
jgi:hypothetical protein